MQKLTLIRYKRTDLETLGKIVLPTKEVIYTLERGWNGNAIGSSCIPAGSYSCRKTWSPRFSRQLYLLSDTSPREGIRIHAANWAHQLEGCIAPCLRIDGPTKPGGESTGVSSSIALYKLETAVDGLKFILDIVEDFK